MAEARLISHIQKYIGTQAERAGMSTTGVKAGSTFYETDTKLTYIWTSSAWAVFAPASMPGSGAIAFATFTDGDETPSIAGGEFFLTANTGATTITGFDGPAANGHKITIIFGDAVTTLAASATLVLEGGQASPLNDFGPAAVLDHITLIYDGTQWSEDSRKLNSS